MRLVDRFVRFFDQREPATPLALVRILLGLTTVLTIGSVVIHGLVPVLWFDIADGGYRSHPQGPWLVQLLGGVRPDVVWRLVALSLIGGTAMIAGVGGRFAALVTALSFRAVTGINSHTGGSYDLLLSNALFLAVLAPTTRTLSVDCKLRTGSWTDDTPQHSWVRWLFVYQIVLTYWTTGLQKVSSHWTPGGDFSALYYILQQPSWHRADMRWIASAFPLTQLGTATSWFWEILAPLWLLAVYYAATREREGRARRWFNRLYVREIFAILGVVFHVAIHVFMNVGPFSLVSLAFYPALYSHEELSRVIRRFSPVRSA